GGRLGDGVQKVRMMLLWDGISVVVRIWILFGGSGVWVVGVVAVGGGMGVVDVGGEEGLRGEVVGEEDVLGGCGMKGFVGQWWKVGGGVVGGVIVSLF
uniref:hypothetical protein n=1 Tax=Paenibacillus xylanexedens TaxID=528191 RepID=UPI001C9318B1